jgi:hypothetical protein
MNRTKIFALAITMGLLVGCKTTEPITRVKRTPPPIPTEATMPHMNYTAKTSEGKVGIWVQPIGREGEPRPDMVFHLME